MLYLVLPKKCLLVMYQILHKPMQLMIGEVAKLHLEMTWHFPTWMRIIMGWWGSPSSSDYGDWSFEESPPTAITYTLTWFSKGATAGMAMASSCNSVALMALHVVHCISSAEQNRATNSIME